MERCPNCGASIRTGARFCTACGFRLVQTADASAVPEPVATVLDPSPSEAVEQPERIVWHREQPDATSTAERSDAVASPDSSPVIATPPSADKESGADIAHPSSESGSSSWSAEPDNEDLNLRPTGMVEAENVRDRPDHVEVDDRSSDAPATMNAQAETIASDFAQSPGPVPTDHQHDSVAASVEQTEHGDGGSDGAPPSADGTRAQESDDDRTRDPMSSLQVDDGDQEATGVSSPWESSSAESSDAPQVRDDVVPGTTFVHESAQPGYYDEAGERASLTGDITQAPDGAGQTVDVEGSNPQVPSPGTGSNTSSDAEAVLTEDQSGGMDFDWEPWGGGTAPAEPTSAGTGTTISSMSSDPTTEASHDHGDAETASSRLARARMLLDELSTIMATIEEPVVQPAVDPASRAAVESIAELGQLLDGFPYPTLDPDRVGELSQLAEDLSGRDYDIRALQRFARERDLILELTVGFEQQRDLLDQIRSILTLPQDQASPVPLATA